MRYAIAFLLLLTGSAAAQTTTITLVQQLSSYLAYEQAEALEYGPPPTCGSNCYHYYRAARLTKQLATAVAACNAGSCLPPLIDESGNVQQPFGTSAVSRGTK
jgi:hypothetical protein